MVLYNFKFFNRIYYFHRNLQYCNYWINQVGIAWLNSWPPNVLKVSHFTSSFEEIYILLYIYIYIFPTLLSYYYYLPWSLSSIYNDFTPFWTPYIFAFKSSVCLSKEFKMFFIRLLLASAVTFCFTSFVFGDTVLVDDESMFSLSLTHTKLCIW